MLLSQLVKVNIVNESNKKYKCVNERQKYIYNSKEQWTLNKQWLSGRKGRKERVPLCGGLQAPFGASRLPRRTPGLGATGVTGVGLKIHYSSSQREMRKKGSRERTPLKNSITRLASNHREGEIRVAVPKMGQKRRGG